MASPPVRFGPRILPVGMLLAGCPTDAPSTEADAAASSGNETGSSSGTSGATETTADASTGSDLPPPTAGRWEAIASMPAPRQETGVVAVHGRVFVIGGFVSTGEVPTVEAYDPVADAWAPVASFPEPHHHPNAAVLGDMIIVAGFLQSLAFTADPRTFVYDPAADAWSPGVDLPVGKEVGASGVAVAGDQLFLMGGLRGSVAVSDVMMFDGPSQTWQPLADLPSPRDHLLGAAVDGTVYAVGGRDGDIGAHTTDVLRYDADADAWTSVAPMPTSRGGIAGAVLRGFIFVAGGEGNAGAASGVYEVFEAYDPGQDAWQVLPAMPTPRHGTGAAVLADRVYVPGGAVMQAYGPTDVSEVWIPE